MQNMNSLMENIKRLQKQSDQQVQQRQNIPQMRLSEKVSIARRTPNSRLTTDYFNALRTEISTPGNPNYNPYFSSTRGTMTDVLDFFGLDSLDDNWFQANSNLQNFAPRTAAGRIKTNRHIGRIMLAQHFNQPPGKAKQRAHLLPGRGGQLRQGVVVAVQKIMGVN